jgi:hypothetical protein
MKFLLLSISNVVCASTFSATSVFESVDGLPLKAGIKIGLPNLVEIFED